MTKQQEREKTEEYRERIRTGLRGGTEADYRQLRALCEEGRYGYLSGKDRELAVFRKVMQIWDLDQNRPIGESIIGRTAALWEEERTDVTPEQLAGVYQMLKYAILRTGSELPEEIKIEGIGRVLAIGLSPGAILMAAELEAENVGQTLTDLAGLMETETIRKNWPQAAVTAAILKGAALRREEGADHA
ncbi:MAG: hypothetical protein K6G16_02445 [Lachnospiraceae bacterium]|nr:hypothetical protein [Lachnospiraceae bacterium]